MTHKGTPVSTTLTPTVSSSRVTILNPAGGKPIIQIEQQTIIQDASGTVITNTKRPVVSELLSATMARPCAAAYLAALQKVTTLADVVAASDAFCDALTAAVLAEQVAAQAAAAAQRAARKPAPAPTAPAAPAPATSST